MLSPGTLQPAFRGLVELREIGLSETHRLVFEPRGSHPFSVSSRPSRTPTGLAALEAHRKSVGRMVGSSWLGTRGLQIPEFHEDYGGDIQCVCPGIYSGCVEERGPEHTGSRKKAWAMCLD